MVIVNNGKNTDFRIKIGNKYLTVASLIPQIINNHYFDKYELYFCFYGDDYRNTGIIVWKEFCETWDDFIKRISKIVFKKLYVIGSSILSEIKYIEFIEFYPYHQINY